MKAASDITEENSNEAEECVRSVKITHLQGRLYLDTRNNRDFGRVMIRSVFDDVSDGI